MLTSEMYRVLMVKSALLVCMSHGSNDVANAISPLSVLIKHNNYSYSIATLIGSSGIALGLLVLGERVMKTVGK